MKERFKREVYVQKKEDLKQGSNWIRPIGFLCSVKRIFE